MLLNFFPCISIRCFPKFIEVVPSDPTMIVIILGVVFHSFCISILRSWYFNIFSISFFSLTIQSIGTAMSIIVLVHFVLSITAISGLCADIALSVCISKSHITFNSLFSVIGSGWCFHGVLLVEKSLNCNWSTTVRTSGAVTWPL